MQQNVQNLRIIYFWISMSIDAIANRPTVKWTKTNMFAWKWSQKGNYAQ